MDDLSIILNQLILVLDRADQESWRTYFITCLERYHKLDTDEARVLFKRDLLSLYGGLGSFSDLVLHKGNKMLYQENIELDNLRKALFEELVASL